MSVSKRKNGSWRFRVWVTLPNGQKRRITGTPKVNTKKAAEHAERVAILEACDPLAAQRLRKASGAGNAIPTLGEYSRTYLAETRSNLKPSTQRDQARICNTWIVPHLGHIQIDELRQSDVNLFIDAMLTGKGRKAISRKTVNNVLTVVKSILAYARENGIIEKIGVKLHIKSQSPEMSLVSDGDLKKLLRTARDSRYRVAILLASEAGLRAGEILALRWEDVGRDVLRVVESRDRSGIFGPTKSWAARTVPLSSALKDALRDLPNTGGSRVITKLGSPEPLGYYALREKVQEIYEEAEVTPPRQPWHAMRHSFCTHLAARIRKPHIIMRLAGHKSIETTMRYMHASDTDLSDAISGAFG